MNSRYYRSPSERLGQGDIFADFPGMRLASQDIEYVRRDPTHRNEAKLFPLAATTTPPIAPFQPSSDEGVATLQIAHAILLTHGCELDKPTPSDVLTAIVRPLDAVPSDRRQAIRDGRVKRTMPLPENDDPYFPESYVDFSRVTTIPPQQILSARRILSPSSELLSALYTAITVYFTRLEIDPLQQEAAVEEAVREADTPYL